MNEIELTISRVLDSLRPLIVESGASIVIDPLPEALGEDAQLAELFENLIANALKFCKDHPKIRISAVPTAAPNGSARHWEFSVADNGIGIEPKYFERIVVIFDRLHARDDHPGTGTGLAVCKRIIEHRGGKIWLEANPSGGSVFKFTLPIPDPSLRSKAG